MNEFYEIEPSIENYWRSIILFGRNVASYKFALAKSLYDLKDSSNDVIKLEELAKPYVKHLLEHLSHSPKQITSKSSTFLSACEQYNKNDISYDELISKATKLGFSNVIDAFHNVHSKEIGKRFFIDERKESGGIRITDDFYKLSNEFNFDDLNLETEARWRLVETGWSLGISRQLIDVQYDDTTKEFFMDDKERRINITSSRDSLNGYQKGKCFYCFDNVSISSKDENLADVDHFFPWILNDKLQNVNGVWNLVLSCKNCNRGESGKFERLPTLELLARLYKRNEYLINSHLPLKETLINQTGKNGEQRQLYLQSQYNIAKRNLIHTWEPLVIKGIITF
ncbi:hypothetical protein JHD47_04125 [Sulfurimonas sp. SAG-AH-194-L11]|nr:HNH endonuclease domain-containing protein [Sulfurimonas sp. SAG-AH-194-L11]MDF1877000.1 hypothetical protein [Sulfurimonas sp. SAG-AH-194-L11]